MCGHAVGGAVGIHSRAIETGGEFWYVAQGVGVCGSPWACPVCSARIGYRRAREIESLLEQVKDEGSAAQFLTLTIPHLASDRLTDLLSVVADGFRFTLSGAPWQRAKAAAGVTGTVRAMEITCGPNGWHAHLHVLLITDGVLQLREQAELEHYFRQRWGRWVMRKMDGRQIHESIGVVLKACTDSQLGDYLSKVEGGKAALELTRTDLKRGRLGHYNPGELLWLSEYAEDADLKAWATARFDEYVWGTKGRKRLVWSKGLKRRYGIDVKSDEELAREEIDGTPQITVSSRVWRDLISDPRGLEDGVLTAGEVAGIPGVVRYLVASGLPVLARDGEAWEAHSRTVLIDYRHTVP